MNPLFTQLLILFFSASLMGQQEKIFTCAVVEQGNVIACETPSRTVVIELWDWSDQVYSEWQWQAKNADSAPYRSVPVVGQELKAKWISRAELDRRLAEARKGKAKTNDPIVAIVLSDGALIPVADCKVRAARQVAKWAAAHPGEPVPNTVRTEPDDCHKRSGKN